MSATEVQQILGRPADVFNYRSAPGPTWIYQVGERFGPTEFDVDFGSDGKMISASERTLTSGG